MKKIVVLALVLYGSIVEAQQTTQDCTEQSVLNEPGRFLDNHTGKAISGSTANANKMMTAFENTCKPKLSFTGGRAKASFMVSKGVFYNRLPAPSYTYNLGFHKFVCNVQTHKLAIVDEYLGVLRITGNPYFQTVFNGSNDGVYNPSLAVFNYNAFSDNRLINAINKESGFIDLDAEQIGGQPNQVLENKPGKGYGYLGSSNNFVTMGTSLIYRHVFITHTDIPFFIPVSRKKFLTDLLAFYDHERPLLVANMQEEIKNLNKTIAESEKNHSSYLQDQKNRLAFLEQNAREIPVIAEQKKQTATKLLQTKDEQWLNLPAVVQRDKKSFTVPADRNRNLNKVYGDFYFTDFYTGMEGLQLYQVNPDYLKKYPPGGAKPAFIDVMYRFSQGDKFLMGVNESFINQLDLRTFRKLMD